MLVIGPRPAFGRGAWRAADSEDEVRRRLVRMLADSGTAQGLRRCCERWRLYGDAFPYSKDRALADRVVAAIRRGRLAAFVVPDTRLSSALEPDPSGAARAIASRAPTSRGPVHAMPVEARVTDVLERAYARDGALIRRVAPGLVEPAAFARAVAVLAAWAAVPRSATPHIRHAVLFGLEASPAGWALLDAADGIERALQVVASAISERALDEAAALLADAIARMGVVPFSRAIDRAADRVKGSAKKAGGGFGKVDQTP